MVAKRTYTCPDTCGSWTTERASKQALRDVLTDIDAFDVYEECRCELIAHHPRSTPKEYLRIDFVLVPQDWLRREGWDSVVGVEAKKSGHKVTGFINQLIDYSWCKVRPSSSTPGRWLMPDLLAVWPLDFGVTGPVLSIMTSHGIGALSRSDGGGLVLRYPADNAALRLDPGMLPVIRDVARIGRKEGSR